MSNCTSHVSTGCDSLHYSPLQFDAKAQLQQTTTYLVTHGTKRTHRIDISGNDDFADQAIANSWDGNGSASTPYIIEGLNITVTVISPIQIVNTTVHFEVRGCLAVGGPTGILLQNVTNAKVWNNTILNSVSCGLFVAESYGVLVANNTVHGISEAASQGLYSHTSEFCEFSKQHYLECEWMGYSCRLLA